MMVVDDEKPIRSWFEHIVKEIDDVEITGSFSNGVSALEACRLDPPDLVFTDIIMPVMNGIELIAGIKQEFPQVEIIILSNFNDFDYVRKGLILGAKDYLLKVQSDDDDIVRFINQTKKQLETKGTGAIADNPQAGSIVVKQMMQYVQENYALPIRLTTLASKLAYNSDYLSQIFKKQTGSNFNSYLTQVRMDKAKELLANGAKVKDVAIAVGYPNEMYFSTSFKNHCGISPRIYGEENHQEN